MVRHPLSARFLLCMLPGLAAFLVAAMVSVWIPAYPNLHDDFGNLLVADTLWHGRLSNPTPPSHVVLQTFHVVVEPTYAAKFPIGSGALMAAGRLALGEWVTGMWIAAGLACAALTWMLLAELPKRWALASGMFAALHPMWQTGWSQEYTNGWLAVAAMALVLGGLLRIRRAGAGIPWTAPLAVSFGLVIGIFSRPFEVAVLSAILGGWVAIGLIRQGCVARISFWRAIAPAAMVLALGLGLQGTVNHCVTGSWLKLPYQLHEEQYGVAPVFVWQKPHEPTLGHRFEEQAQYHRIGSMACYTNAASWTGYARLLEKRTTQIVSHWGWMLAVVPLAIVAAPRLRARYGMILIAALITLGVINGIPWVSQTYVAPLIPLALLLSALGVRAGVSTLARQAGDSQREEVQRHRRLQSLAIFGLLAMQAIGLVVATRSMISSSANDPEAWFVRRSRVESELSQKGGGQLVIVRYARGHDIHHEWVFNGANPPTAPIVWARWDESFLEQLLLDYPARSVWILDVATDDSYQMLAYQRKDPSEQTDGSLSMIP